MTIVLFSRIFYDAKDLSEFPLYMTPCLQKVFFCSALDPFHFDGDPDKSFFQVCFFLTKQKYQKVGGVPVSFSKISSLTLILRLEMF